MKKVIVTGANGFIGRNLVQELLRHQYMVYAIVRDRSVEKEFDQDSNLRFLECEMDQYEKLLDYPELQGAFAVFHLAWAGVSDSLSMDYAAQLGNVKGSCDLQMIAAQLGAQRFLFADSIMEYEYQKAAEDPSVELSLRYTYAIAKHTAHDLLRLRASSLKIDFISIILSNAYGIGEDSPRLVNRVIRKYLSGEHMSFTPGEQLYDFIYIEDAVRAIRMAAEHGTDQKEYYIGNRKPRKLKFFLQEIRDIVAPEMSLGLGELAFHGTSLEYNEFDTGAIYEELGFYPKYTFSQGIKITAEWIRKKRITNENSDSSRSYL